ncbi:hypothetical protein [Candidatus Protofrankia californiensis]|uniref:hypothetical protein n=1 Tax=Candidatus Protofrankia californiensis TaxID=1839754 RepID=UPI0019D2A7B6|nr:hypothetical protein [Candidatus Protofrankia californiensis]
MTAMRHHTGGGLTRFPAPTAEEKSAGLLEACIAGLAPRPFALIEDQDDRLPGHIFAWRLQLADRPDLDVILEAGPEGIAERLTDRGPCNRFQLPSDSSHAEVRFYRQATERLIQAGFDVLRVDVNHRPPEQFAAPIRDRPLPFFMLAAE